jgi:hypothetical protein
VRHEGLSGSLYKWTQRRSHRSSTWQKLIHYSRLLSIANSIRHNTERRHVFQISYQERVKGEWSLEGEGKCKVVPAFFWAPRHEGILGEWRYSSTHSLTSALDGGEWSASVPAVLPPRERAPGTHWIGDWVGPRACLDAVVKKKIPSSRRESKPRTPIVKPIVQHYTDWAITAHVEGEEELSIMLTAVMLSRFQQEITFCRHGAFKIP